MRNVGLTEGDHFRAMENLQEVQHLPSISPVNLNYFGAEQCKKGYTFGPYVRMSYVIHIIKEGKGELEKNGKIKDMDLEEAINSTKEQSRDLLGVSKNLVRQ